MDIAYQDMPSGASGPTAQGIRAAIPLAGTATLDGDGNASIVLPRGASTMVVSYNSDNATGLLWARMGGDSQTWNVTSLGHGSDAGLSFCYLAF